MARGQCTGTGDAVANNPSHNGAIVGLLMDGDCNHWFYMGSNLRESKTTIKGERVNCTAH